MESEILAQRLRDYVSGLTVEARRMLVRSIEASKAREDISLEQEIILRAVRESTEEMDLKVKRRPTTERVFFIILDPFIIDEKMPRRAKSKISRSSLRFIWRWLIRDLAPGQLDEPLAALRAAVAQDDKGERIKAAMKLRATFVKVVRELIASMQDHPKNHQRMIGQLGEQQTYDDLLDILDIFELERPLMALRQSLPSKISLGAAGIEQISKGINTFEKTVPNQLIFAFASIMPNLTTAGELARFAVEMIGSDNPANIRHSKYACCIDLIISDIERQIEALSNALQAHDAVKAVQIIHVYRDIIRTLEMAVDCAAADPWMKTLGIMKSKMSDLIKPEIEPAPNLIRQALKRSISNNKEVTPDPHAVDDALFAVKLLDGARSANDELALHNLILQCRASVEKGLETFLETSFDDLRAADNETFMPRSLRVDGAIKITAVIFGDDFAALKRRAKHSIIEKLGKDGIASDKIVNQISVKAPRKKMPKTLSPKKPSNESNKSNKSPERRLSAK